MKARSNKEFIFLLKVNKLKAYSFIKNYKYSKIPRKERIEKRENETIRLAAKGCKSLTDLFRWKNLNVKVSFIKNYKQSRISRKERIEKKEDETMLQITD